MARTYHVGLGQSLMTDTSYLRLGNPLTVNNSRTGADTPTDRVVVESTIFSFHA